MHALSKLFRTSLGLGRCSRTTIIIIAASTAAWTSIGLGTLRSQSVTGAETSKRVASPESAPSIPMSSEASATSAIRDVRPRANLIVLGQNIATMDPRFPTARAIAVRDGRVVAVGQPDAVLALRGKDTRVIDAGNGLVMPGFIESHAHFIGLGAQLRNVGLVGTKSYDEVIARVVAAARKLEKGEWVVGRGWDQNHWPEKAFPSHERLSRAVPDHPVYLTRVDGHAALVNVEALRLAGINADTPSPSGGEIIRTGDGTATGVLIDTAKSYVSRHLPRTGPALTKRDMLAAQDLCFRSGITTFHDAGASRADIRLLDELYDQGKLAIRLYVMLGASAPEDVKRLTSQPPRIGDHGGRLSVRSFKLYMDGALGSRGAALLEDYADRKGHRGLALLDAKSLDKMSRRALDAGYQVNVHAIGDAGNRTILDTWDKLFAERPRGREARFRIEHAQILDEADIPRFAELGVVASMQGVHCTSDMDWVPTRLGEARTKEGAYVWKKLVDSGAVLCNGTDAPVESISALDSFYATVTRQHKDGTPAGGWYPEQRLSRHEALYSYTMAGAYAAFEENVKGSLSPGKHADIVILDRNILTCAAPQILTTRVTHTIVGGRIVHTEE